MKPTNLLYPIWHTWKYHKWVGYSLWPKDILWTIRYAHKARRLMDLLEDEGILTGRKLAEVLELYDAISE